MPRKITLEDVEALMIGGTILGGGGGGRPDIGRAAGKLAMELGGIELWSPEETPPSGGSSSSLPWVLRRRGERRSTTTSYAPSKCCGRLV